MCPLSAILREGKYVIYLLSKRKMAFFTILLREAFQIELEKKSSYGVYCGRANIWLKKKKKKKENTKRKW